MAVDSAGNVYVYQRGEPPVVVFDPNGGFLRSWGGGQIVVMDRENGVLIGASDPRKDGMALGY